MEGSSGLGRRQFALGTASALLTPSACSRRSYSDIIVHGGPIYTGVGANRVEAVRIRKGVIAFAGPLTDARANSSEAKFVNLQGAAAYPGFVDSHVHLADLGLQSTMLDVTGIPSLAAMLVALKAYAKTHPEGPIIGAGWIETHWPEHRFPNRDDLDAAVSDRPVYLTRADGHAAVCNSAMLRIAGISEQTRDPAGGRIERADGRPTGILVDDALDLAATKLPEPSPRQKREAIRAAARLYASRGWTGVANMSTPPDQADIFDELASSGELPLKTDLYLTPEALDAFCSTGPTRDRTGLVNRRGIKMYMDGALGSRGAALLAPYSDMPQTSGLLVTPLEELRGIAARVRRAGGQIATHAIGDRANRLTLDLYQNAFADDVAALRQARWRIEHSQIVSLADIPRFGRLGVIASMQPSHCISDMYFAPARLGKARLPEAYAWQSLLRSGAVICAGTDAPVEKGDPLIEFYAAVCRHSLSGFATLDWHLEQGVTRQQALRMFTQSAAFASFQERKRGTLALGMKADLSAFSHDLMTADFADIPRARAVLTISEGRITRQAL